MNTSATSCRVASECALDKLGTLAAIKNRTAKADGTVTREVAVRDGGTIHLVVHGTAPVVGTVTREVAVGDIGTARLVVHSAAVESKVVREVAVGDGGTAQLVEHSAASAGVTTRNREPIKDRVQPLAAPAGDHAPKGLSIDGRQLRPI